jgi:hypothetical protein
MQTVITHKFQDHLPKVPQEWFDLAKRNDPSLRTHVYDTTNFEYGKDPTLTRKPVDIDGNPVIHVGAYRFKMPDEFIEWCRQNITTNFHESSVHITNKEQGVLGPHTDRARNWSLIYVVQPGGPKVRTCFWQEKGHPLVRDRFIWFDEYTKLDLIESADFGVGRWVLVSSIILHSVEYLEDHRITFQISLNDDIDMAEFGLEGHEYHSQL